MSWLGEKPGPIRRTACDKIHCRLARLNYSGQRRYPYPAAKDGAADLRGRADKAMYQHASILLTLDPGRQRKRPSSGVALGPKPTILAPLWDRSKVPDPKGSGGGSNLNVC